MLNWGRIITAMVTPMYADGSINYDKAVEFANFLKANGTTAIVAAGTTGESPTVTGPEKTELFKALKKGVDIPIIAGVGTNSTAATIENIKAAEACGVDGLLAVVPYYNKPNAESLYAHFKALNDAASKPIMLYNVPGRTGVNMSAETTVALSRLANIAALKEASGNLEQLATVVRDADADFLVYTGEDGQILPSLAVGAYGVVSVAAHCVGPLIEEMIILHLEGKPAEAGRCHRNLIEICKKLFMTANPIPVKAAVNLMGFDVGTTRLPLAPASAEVIAALTKELNRLGAL